MRIPWLAVVVAAVAVQQSQPTIRSGVDLIRLDVAVVDKSGRPVPDLRAEDFSVRIDGSERAVSFATFYGADRRTSSAPPETAIASFATNEASRPGRTIIFVVDLESFAAGHEKVILETAGTLLDGLASSDSAGLLGIPGRTVELTRDHARVKSALASLHGLAQQSRQRYALSINEADAFARRDTRTMADVTQRECPRSNLNCPGEVAEDAKLLLVEANRRIQAVLTALTTLNDGLRHVDTPKSLVLLSAGLPYTIDGRTKFNDLQRRSAESGTLTYVVHVEHPEMDASRSRLPGISSLPRADLALGLTNIAGVTRGEYFAGVGKAAGVLERVQTEISNSYQLGVEARPGDADGRTRKIDVRVTRSGLTVKARRELTLPTTARAARTPVEVLAVPTPFTEVPLAVSTYTVRGEEPDTLKVLMLVEPLGSSAAEAHTFAYSITNAKDQQVFASSDKTSPSGSLGPRGVAGIQLAAGKYRLRAALVDSAGRAGSVDMPLGIGLRQAGPFEASDLMLGQYTDQFTPATHLPAGTPITALLELYGSDPAVLNAAGVDLELRKSDDEKVLGRAQATVAETDVVRRRAAAGQLATTGLAPGLYDVSALIRNGVARVGIVSRRVVIK